MTHTANGAGTPSHATLSTAAQLQELQAQVDDLKERCGSLGERSKTLSKRCHDLGDRLRAANARAADTQARYDELRLALPDTLVSQKLFTAFVESSRVTLRPEVLDAYYERLRAKTPPDVVDEHARELATTGYERLLEQLFAEEMLVTRVLDARSLREVSSFQRGRRDLENASRAGKHLHEVVKPKVDITHRVLTTLINDEDFDRPPERICEIGGAWGATIKYLSARFGPSEYQNYEIDAAYARWAEEQLGARAMPVDGETLSATEDGSVDLAIANNVLFFMPPIKAWSYLREMARVTRRGGLVLFNALVADRCSEQALEDMMANFFPRRAFSLLPEHFIRIALPSTHFRLIRSTTDPGSVEAPYFVYKRVRGTRKRASPERA